MKRRNFFLPAQSVRNAKVDHLALPSASCEGTASFKDLYDLPVCTNSDPLRQFNGNNFKLAKRPQEKLTPFPQTIQFITFKSTQLITLAISR